METWSDDLELSNISGPESIQWRRDKTTLPISEEDITKGERLVDTLLGNQLTGSSRSQSLCSLPSFTSLTEEDNESLRNLIQEEKMETKSVSSSVYILYFQAFGFYNIIIVLLSGLLNAICNVGTNAWLTVWTNDPNSTIHSQRDLYLGIYAAFGFGEALMTFILVFVIALAGLNASSKIHSVMLRNITSAPMFFFDTTPKGRIVNRFSKDIDNLDWNIPSTITGLVGFGFNMISPIFVLSYVNPIFINHPATGSLLVHRAKYCAWSL